MEVGSEKKKPGGSVSEIGSEKKLGGSKIGSEKKAGGGRSQVVKTLAIKKLGGRELISQISLTPLLLVVLPVLVLYHLICI